MTETDTPPGEATSPQPQPAQTFGSDFDGLKKAAAELATRREETSAPDSAQPEEVGIPGAPGSVLFEFCQFASLAWGPIPHVHAMSRERTFGAKRALEAERKFHRRGRELAAQAKRKAKQAARGRQHKPAISLPNQ